MNKLPKMYRLRRLKMRQGLATTHSANGSVFEGEFKDGKRHGFGRCIYAAGALYEGNWSDDKRHGLGRMEWSFGNSYEGLGEIRSRALAAMNGKMEMLMKSSWRNAKRRARYFFWRGQASRLRGLEGR